jgi:hypothetical protein
VKALQRRITLPQSLRFALCSVARSPHHPQLLLGLRKFPAQKPCLLFLCRHVRLQSNNLLAKRTLRCRQRLTLLRCGVTFCLARLGRPRCGLCCAPKSFRTSQPLLRTNHSREQRVSFCARRCCHLATKSKRSKLVAAARQAPPGTSYLVREARLLLQQGKCLVQPAPHSHPALFGLL